MRMLRAPALPCLPGFSFDKNLGRTRFPKNICFDKIHDGVFYLSEKTHEQSRYPSIYPRGEVQEVPPWIAFDGQRLMFKAFFQETVQERWKSSYQIRIVTISFFLEDGTLKITEPPVDNSGLEQGVLVKRQRIPMPNPANYRYYDIIDLNIGKEPEIFCRVYKIVDCDKFTRRFLNRMGISVPDPIDIPKDPYIEARKIPAFPKKPKRTVDTFGDFLKYDRQVLRFYAYWDDTESPYGAMHDLEIHYYLADSTMEVKQKLAPNSGIDSSVILVKRTKLPKFYSGLDPIGVKEPFTVLNVLGENIARSYMTIDSLDAGRISRAYYKDNNLYIGSQINVYGRRVVIIDMDTFTKEYYRKKYGIEDFTPLERPRKPEEICQKVEKYIPPYNGFGTYEDSLGNCFTMLPKAPKVDFVKFLYYDKQGFDSHLLRFRARMISKIPEYAERHFICRIFLMDDTISIFELTKRNSGFTRCLFLKKTRVMLPKQEIYTNKPPLYYKPEDFYVGARVHINGFLFEIISADVYALRYMELNSAKFLKANIKLIMGKLHEALKPVYKEFIKEYSPLPATDNGIQVVAYEKLKEALCKYLGDKITEHELITIARHYSPHEKREFRTREYVRQLIHTEIYRFLWNEADRLEGTFHHWDRGRTGYLPRDTVYKVLRGSRLPIDIELLNSMLDHLHKNEEGNIDYKDLLRFVDVKVDPLPPAVPINVKTALWWASEKEPDCGTGIDWCVFLKELDVKLEEGTLEEVGQNASAQVAMIDFS